MSIACDRCGSNSFVERIQLKSESYPLPGDIMENHEPTVSYSFCYDLCSDCKALVAAACMKVLLATIHAMADGEPDPVVVACGSCHENPCKCVAGVPPEICESCGKPVGSCSICEVVP